MFCLSAATKRAGLSESGALEPFRRNGHGEVNEYGMVKVSLFVVQGSGFRVQGSGFRVQGSGFRVQGSGSRVQGSGLRVEI